MGGVVGGDVIVSTWTPVEARKLAQDRYGKDSQDLSAEALRSLADQLDEARQRLLAVRVAVRELTRDTTST